MTTASLRFAVYALLGVAVGLIVAFLDWITLEVALHALIEGPRWAQIVFPVLGFVAVPALLTHWKINARTSDAYIETYHTGSGAEPDKLPKKTAANIITIATGGAVGLEGTAVLTGATIGQWIGDRRPDVIGKRNRLVLVVAGAAAGVASLFKAPATGVLFAMESPYRRDLSRHGLVPALFASAAAYLTFVLIIGDERLLDIASEEVSVQQGVLAAVILGFLGGGVARAMSYTFRWAKRVSREVSYRVRLPIAAVSTGLSVFLALELVELPATLGPGATMAVEIVGDSNIAVGAIVALFFLRVIATSSSLAMSGVGGLFIPLVVQGLLLGRAVELLIGAPSTGLYPVIGLAVVLGAGYRTPLAAVMFVAETTGRAEFVIPALIGVAISQALMGDMSVSMGQIGERQGRLERRLDEAASAVMIADLGSLKPDTSLLDVIDKHGDRPVSPAIAVADPEYKGLLVLHDVAMNILEHGMDATASDSMRDLPAVHEDAPAMEAARLMNAHDTAAIAVVDKDNIPVGVVSAMSLAGLNEASMLTDIDPRA